MAFSLTNSHLGRNFVTMRSFFAKYKLFGIVMLALSAIIVYLFYDALQPKKMLPVYQPSMVDKSLVDSTLHYTKKYHKVADFSLVNQNGDTITQENYKDKIYVADFFFTIEKGVIDSKCNLVTGDKKQIYELARKSYLAVKTDGDGGPFDMVHTENFILVDKEKRIRGFYDGTNREDIKRLLEDIKILEASYLE